MENNDDVELSKQYSETLILPGSKNKDDSFTSTDDPSPKSSTGPEENEKSSPEIWGLKVRPNGVTKWNLAAFFMGSLVGDLIASFLVTYSTYALKEIYHLDGNIAKTLGVIGLITGPLRLTTLVASGPLIESAGRRWPQAIGSVFYAIGLFIIPLGLQYSDGQHSAYSGYLIGTILMTLNNLCAANPWVADIIMEESQGYAIMVSILCSNIGCLIGTGLVSLSDSNLFTDSKDPAAKGKAAYFLCFFISVTSSIFIVNFMKDPVSELKLNKKIKTFQYKSERQIVQEGQAPNQNSSQVNLRSRVEGETRMQQLVFVFSQAGKTIKEEPQIGFAIVGRVITMGIRLIGQQTTILAITQNIGASGSKSYVSTMLQESIFIGFPGFIIYGKLIKNYDLPRLLLVSIAIVVILGFIMTANTFDAGKSWIFKFSYVFMESVDCCNILITETMLQNKLKADSRAILIMVQQFSIGIGCMLLNYFDGIIQNSYHMGYIFPSPVAPGSTLQPAGFITGVKDEDDNVTGAYHVYFINYSILAVYWIALLCFVIYRTSMGIRD